jgi:hypothetical protein
MPSPAPAPESLDHHGVEHKVHGDGLLQEAVEQPAPVARGPVEPGCVLIEVVVETLPADGAMVRAQQPTLEERGDAVDTREHGFARTRRCRAGPSGPGDSRRRGVRGSFCRPSVIKTVCPGDQAQRPGHHLHHAPTPIAETAGGVRDLVPLGVATVDLDVPHRKFKTPRVVDQRVELSDYEGTLRQLLTRDLGHDEPTILLTNDRTSSLKAIITRYSLADSIPFFHLDALSSAVALNVDFDVLLIIIASAIYRLFGRTCSGRFASR